jgi:ankyrin repeat protein
MLIRFASCPIRQDEYYYDFFSRPLHVLIEKDQFNLFQDAIEDTFADINLLDESGRSPLLLAVQRDKLNFVEALVKKGADLNAQKDKKNRTALHVACAYRASKELVKFLLKKKADVNVKDGDGGNTPLHTAAARNHVIAVELLLEKGAKINAANDAGDTPVTSALLHDASDAVRLLLRNGADIYKKNEKDLAVWEVSQRKDMVNTEPRKVFMEELNVHDAREFEFRTKYPSKATAMGARIHADYDKSTQFSVTTKTATKAVFMITTQDPNIKSLDFANKTGFVVVQSDQGKKKEPSFQVTGARGIGGGKPRAIDIEPNYFYNVIPYSKTADIDGEYMLIVLTQDGAKVEISELAPWKYCASAEGDWVGKNAGGAQQHDTFKNNPMYEVTLPKEDGLEFCVFLSQEEDDPKFRLVQGGDHKVVNYGQHIGFYIMDRGAVKTLDQTTNWVDSRDTVKYVKLDASERNHITIVPCTVNPGDESPYTLKVFCDEAVSIKEK